MAIARRQPPRMGDQAVSLELLPEESVSYTQPRRSMSEALTNIGRHKALVLTTFLLSAAVFTGLAVFLVRPSYVAVASVLVQDPQPLPGGETQHDARGVVTTDVVAIRTQVDVLGSRNLARTVVQQLHLGDDPTFETHASPLRETLSAFAPSVFGRVDQNPQTASEREEAVIGRLTEMISIVNDGRSYVIDIRAKVPAAGREADDHARALAATLANDYAQAYVAFTQQTRTAGVRHLNDFLEQRLAILQQQARAADDAVQDYRARHGLTENRGAGGAGITVAGQQLSQLNGDLMAASADRVQRDASLAQLKQARAGHGNLDAIPEVVGSVLIGRLREQQAQIDSDAAKLTNRNGAAYPGVASIRAAQQKAKARIDQEIRKVGDSLQSAAEVSRLREAALREQLTRLQAQVVNEEQQSVELLGLQREAEAARALYADYLKRSAETANLLEFKEGSAIVASQAGIPLHAAAPTVLHFIAAGVLASLFVALMAPVARRLWARGFETVEQFEYEVGLEVLGLIPRVRHPKEALRFDDRGSFFSEAIASVRALLRLQSRNVGRVVLVTSALPGEGKTFCSTALARQTAMAGQRVLLIDCDVRRPSVHALVGVDGGRTELVPIFDVEDAPSPALSQDPISTMHIMAVNANALTPQDLFAAPETRRLIEALRLHYDLIVLDAPPILVVSDARVLTTLADETVLVVNWKTTPRDCVTAAKAALTNAKIAGAIMNRVRLQHLRKTSGVYGYMSRRYGTLAPQVANAK